MQKNIIQLFEMRSVRAHIGVFNLLQEQNLVSLYTPQARVPSCELSVFGCSRERIWSAPQRTYVCMTT